MSDMIDLVRVLTAATGNGTPITLGTAYSQLFMTPAEANAVDGRTYTYLIVDGNNWELGKGVYTASGTSLARTTVLASRISGTLGTSRITLSGTAQVRFVQAAEDIGALRGTRPVTGTSDTISTIDLGRTITYSNASAIAATLAQAGASSQFLDGWDVYVKNTGVGTLTITPTTSTVNGAASLALATNLGAFIWSDGSNYHAFVFPLTAPLLAANNLTDVASKKSSLDNLSVHASTVASASTVDLESATGYLVDISGTTGITAITLNDGHRRVTRFQGIVTLTGGANLVLPNGAATLTTQAGDVIEWAGYGSSVVRAVGFLRASAGHILGEPSNGDAAAGEVGEYGNLTVNVTPGVTFTTSGTDYNIASRSFLPGDYDVWATAVYVPGGSTNATQMLAWISTTTASNPGTDSGDVSGFSFGSGITGGSATHLNVITKRILIPSTTTVYLSGRCNFTSTAPTFGGTIKWRRRR